MIISGNSAGDFGLAEKDNRLVQTLKQFWETESIGIHEPRLKTEDEKEEFMAHIKHNGERYEIGLPWKDDSLPIPSHYQQSYNRLRSQVKERASSVTRVRQDNLRTANRSY